MRMESLQKVLFGVGVAMLCFGWGLLTTRAQVFPYRYLKQAELAFESELKMMKGGGDDDDWRAWHRDHPTPLTGPQARFLTSRAPTEPILLVCPDLTGQPRDGRRELVRIVDRRGYTLHTWSATDEWLRGLALRNGVILRQDSIVYACGAEVDDAGNLLVSMQTHRGFPYGASMARMDRDSKPEWTAPLAIHHWFSVADDGSIYAPWQEAAPSPLSIEGSLVRVVSPSGQIFHDGIVKLSARGEVVDKFSIFEVLAKSGLASLLNSSTPSTSVPAGGQQILEVSDADPLHLNDVQVVCERHLPSRPGLEVGDLLVSLRTPSVLAVISPRTRTVKWHATRHTLFQHSPRLLPQGVLAFDNLGGDLSMGGTRLALVDLFGGPTTTVFPRQGVPIPETFFSMFTGHIDVHPDGTRALVASIPQGVIWEIDLKSGEVLWEYVSPESKERPTARQSYATAKYCRPLNWIPAQVATTATAAP